MSQNIVLFLKIKVINLLISLFKGSFIKFIYFYKTDKIINDVSLKKLTFQIRQTKWDGGSIYITLDKKKKCLISYAQSAFDETSYK